MFRWGNRVAAVRFIRKAEALKIAGCGSSKWNADKADGLMPQPVYFSPTDARYLLHEVEIACAAWAAGKPTNEIRALIKDLHDRRPELLERALKDALTRQLE